MITQLILGIIILVCSILITWIIIASEVKENDNDSFIVSDPGDEVEHLKEKRK